MKKFLVSWDFMNGDDVVHANVTVVATGKEGAKRKAYISPTVCSPVVVQQYYDILAPNGSVIGQAVGFSDIVDIIKSYSPNVLNVERKKSFKRELNLLVTYKDRQEMFKGIRI